MYKRDCLQKIGGASSSIKYTEGFVDDIISLPFFSELYHNRGLNKSNQVKKDSIQKLINAINKFYYAYIDLPSFCEFYDKFTAIDQDSRLIQLSFVDELVGAKVTLDVFQYLLSNMDALRSMCSGKSISWLHYFVYHDFGRILLDDTSTTYLSLYKPDSSLVEFNKVTHLRIIEKTADLSFHPNEYILSWEDKLIYSGTSSISIEQFAISAITFNSWILLYTNDCTILNCELPSGDILDQNLSFFTGNRLHSFFDNDLELSVNCDHLNYLNRDLVCISPVHFLRYLIDIYDFPSSMSELITCFINTLLGHGILEVKLNSISYLSSAEHEKYLNLSSCDISKTKTISRRLSVKGALLGEPLKINTTGITPFIEQPLFSRDTIYISEDNFLSKFNLCFIFCHFNAEGELNKAVQYYLKALSELGDIIFVSNSPALSENLIALEFLNEICVSVYVRDNDSYDFGCWAYGITRNLSKIRSQYENLVCCNDSCIGPFSDLKPILNDFICGNIDVGGLTANKDRGLHLQSYFIFYGKNIINSNLFKIFWENIRGWQDKNDIINHYEVSWLRVLILSGYNVSVFFSEYFDTSNNTVMKPLELLQSGFPFIKREVIEKNPFKIDLRLFLNSVSKLYPEATTLIETIDPGEYEDSSQV